MRRGCWMPAFARMAASVSAEHRRGSRASAATGHIRSRVPMPDIPGIGFEAKNKLYAGMKPMLQTAAH